MACPPQMIRIKNARQNNLKGVDVEIPCHAITVITGPSGSGKSSLAFDTLYAEGQRRYVETFSPYIRQFLERMDKPMADSIEGIPPAIALEQGNTARTTRSTVGTLTEINDYLKLLFSRATTLFCTKCGKEVRALSPQEIVASMLDEEPWHGQAAWVTFDVPFPQETPLREALDFLRAQCYTRIFSGGKMCEIRAGDTPQGMVFEGCITVVADRVTVEPSQKKRLLEAVESALRLGKGHAAFHDSGGRLASHFFSSHLSCRHDGVSFRTPFPGLFSFNHPTGACPACRGFGRTMEIDWQRVMPDATRTLRQGVVKPWLTGFSKECQEDLIRTCKKKGIPLDVPFCEMSPEHQKFVVEGEPFEGSVSEAWEQGKWYGVKGYFKWLESKTYKMHIRVFLSRYRAYQVCAACSGTRYQPETLAWKLGVHGATPFYSIAELCALPVSAALSFLTDVGRGSICSNDAAVSMLLKAVVSRLGYLDEVGLGYLSLDRSARTLSGGEAQRVNLTACLGASLVNTLFVLDEPSVGLHPRDTDRLARILAQLKNAGNTVVVVEHDERIIRSADHILDLGPGRGRDGGRVVYAGDAGGITSDASSLTGSYLSGKKMIPIPSCRRPLPTEDADDKWLRLRGASENNLKNIDLDIPLGLLVCLTGVSGSGKSTLAHDVLHKNLLRQRGTAAEEAGCVVSVEGGRAVSEIVLVDQSPLSKTPRSNPILYVGAYDAVRELFAATDGAMSHGLNASAFSFNTGHGRCDRCQGMGSEKIEMQFLSDLFVKCPVCEGKRFQPHVLGVRYCGYSISDMLEMTIGHAVIFFRERKEKGDTLRERVNAETIISALEWLEKVGLGYLTLGQPLSQLSGGEAQRVKLAGRLAKIGQAKNLSGKGDLLILDEPTTGLHFDDIIGLAAAMHMLVDAGHSLLVIEHNLDVIKNADWIIDLGPEAGERGGEIVACGTPEEIAAHPASLTGAFLKEHLAPRPKETVKKSPKKQKKTAGPPKSLQVIGARHHNLKNISVSIPLDTFAVVTGPSGSGKSSLAFDVIFAEGQRRYLDCLNAYARQFIGQAEKPDVDSITGIPPTVAIEQQTTRGGGKSTVATLTEIHTFVRLLFSKLGVQHDPDTGEIAIRQSAAEIQERVARALSSAQAKPEQFMFLAPLIKGRKGTHMEIARWAQKKNYPLLRVDGEWVDAVSFPVLDRYREHTIEAMIGFPDAGNKAGELMRLVSETLSVGGGQLVLLDEENERETLFSTLVYCPGSGRSFPELDPRLFSFYSPHGWCPECEGYGTLLRAKLTAETPLEREVEMEMKREWEEDDEGQALPVCPSCQGTRMNPVARAVRFCGANMESISRMSVSEAASFFGSLELGGREGEIARDIIPEILQRLHFLGEVGLDYLGLGRGAKTLSGGESQRIRLAAQLGSRLRGVLYVLDEPSIGLHPRDNGRLLASLERLRDNGNSLLVVEHDEETMRRSGHLLDLGPGAGIHGGHVVASGSWKKVAADPASVTGLALKHPMRHPSRGSRRGLEKVEWLEIKKATANNLKSVNFRLPLDRLTVLTGVSGSGKSTLMREVLLPAVQGVLRGKKRAACKKKESTAWGSISGADSFGGVVEADQSPIGKTSRSTPATYTGLFDEIRKCFAMLPEARMRGFDAGRFSFNTAGGQCAACKGHGSQKVAMSLLPTLHVPCEVCEGKRYNEATLQILFKGRSIADCLAMTVEEACVFFEAQPKIHRILYWLQETGLGYLTLGQSSPTLSGGEAQRLKLVTELSGSASSRCLYLLEEPTIGLHQTDVRLLVDVLHKLVDSGHTVVVIEHNLDVVAEADYLVDLGPEGGGGGGRIVATGTPEEVAAQAGVNMDCHTAPFLAQILHH